MRLTQPPAAEWRPDATTPGASDGDGDPAWTAYPRVSVPAPLATTVGTSQLLPDGFARVGRAVQVLLGLCGVSSLATVGFEFWGLAAMAAATENDFVPALSGYDALGPYFAFGPPMLMAITGVLWLAWQHRLAAAVPRRTLRRSPGWHVGSWFIPFAGMWFPFQNIADLHSAVTPGDPGRGTPPAYRLWWGLWLASSIAGWVANAVEQGETTFDLIRQVAAATAVGEALNAGAAVFAILVVGDLTRRAVQARDDAVAESELR